MVVFEDLRRWTAVAMQRWYIGIAQGSVRQTGSLPTLQCFEVLSAVLALSADQKAHTVVGLKERWVSVRKELRRPQGSWRVVTRRILGVPCHD